MYFNNSSVIFILGKGPRMTSERSHEDEIYSSSGHSEWTIIIKLWFQTSVKKEYLTEMKKNLVFIWFRYRRKSNKMTKKTSRTSKEKQKMTMQSLQRKSYLNCKWPLRLNCYIFNQNIMHVCKFKNV